MLNKDVARALVEIGAVGFTPRQPITFKSGILAPVYVDNRRLIYWPAQWRIIVTALQTHITHNVIEFDVLAGIATGGIPHCSALAYQMGKPSVYIRKESKEHGRASQIEGGSVEGQRVLLVEDMVTTGGSSLAGVTALREAGAQVEHCLAITTYGFPMSRQAFQVAQVQLHPLTDFRTIVDAGLAAGLLEEGDVSLIEDWLNEPHRWAERQGFEDVST
jgi:orotate phosphoribosyltransferase